VPRFFGARSGCFCTTVSGEGLVQGRRRQEGRERRQREQRRPRRAWTPIILVMDLEPAQGGRVSGDGSGGEFGRVMGTLSTAGSGLSPTCHFTIRPRSTIGFAATRPRHCPSESTNMSGVALPLLQRVPLPIRGNASARATIRWPRAEQFILPQAGIARRSRSPSPEFLDAHGSGPAVIGGL
jgi:hypothetical protein